MFSDNKTRRAWGPVVLEGTVSLGVRPKIPFQIQDVILILASHSNRRHKSQLWQPDVPMSSRLHYKQPGDFPEVQWLRGHTFTAGGTASIPGRTKNQDPSCSVAWSKKNKTRLMSKKQQKRNLKTRQMKLCSHSVTGSPVFTHGPPATHKKNTQTHQFQNCFLPK